MTLFNNKYLNIIVVSIVIGLALSVITVSSSNKTSFVLSMSTNDFSFLGFPLLVFGLTIGTGYLLFKSSMCVIRLFNNSKEKTIDLEEGIKVSLACKNSVTFPNITLSVNDLPLIFQSPINNKQIENTSTDRVNVNLSGKVATHQLKYE